MAKKSSISTNKRTCLCSPTTHPGSFRCKIHRCPKKSSSRPPSTRANINNNNGLLKAFLLQIISPSRHDQRRRWAFRPRPTRFRLSISNANNVLMVNC
ncbi:hypothetical protein RND81_11G131000 [Saponaria officinalis]|uniref:Uncharacterized protein n=1 Tax=Saponaria officinalis TaxID=3572 RepID=A0AAW1HN85_SAPOF